MKMFNNGTIHMTGCKKISEMETLISICKGIISRAIPEVNVEYDVSNLKINMIHTSMNVQRTLNLHDLHDWLINKNHNSLLEPKIYSSLVLKLENQTCLIHKSGKISSMISRIGWQTQETLLYLVGKKWEEVSEIISPK